MHGLVKIDCVEDFDPVIRVNKCISNLEQSRALRKRFVNTENDNSLKKIIVLMIN